MYMENWKLAQFYCQPCERWYGTLQHRACPLGEPGSLLWIDMNNFQMGCDKCNTRWQPETTIYYCPYGHAQQTEYTDSVVAVDVIGQELWTDGIWVYVLTDAGTVVAGRRDLRNVSTQ